MKNPFVGKEVCVDTALLPGKARQVMEQGSYMLLAPGMEVRGADGHSLGTISEVVADENADIFRGFVLAPGLLSAHVFVPGEHVVSVVNDIATVDLDRNSTASLQPASELSTRTE